MANTNTPFGFQMVRGGSASTYDAQGSIYSIASTESNAMYLGDGVKAAASSDTNGVANVTKITNGTDALRGVITGIFSVYPGAASIQGTPLLLENINIPATKTQIYYVLVSDDPTVMYVMQDDGITTANLVAASANLNSTYTVTAGATAQNVSASVLLSSSFAVTNTFNLKLEGLAQRPGNGYGAYAKWNVRINLSELTGSFVGI